MATETWVLNETLTNSALSKISVNFQSNSKTCVAIERYYDDEYEEGLRYYTSSSGSQYELVYANQGSGGEFFDQAYRTITFATAPTGTLLTWLQANGTKQETPKVTVDLTSLSGYESLPAGTYALAVKSKAANYQDSDLSQTVSFTKLAAPVVTASDTTVTWDAVSNAESYDVYVDGELYENTTGGVTYNITTTVTNGTYSGDTTITDTATVTITANSGYTLPDTVTVTGASQSWNKETGTLTLTNPTGNVTVEAVCVAAGPTIEAGTYRWVNSPSIPSFSSQNINFVSNNYTCLEFYFPSYGSGFNMSYRYLKGSSEEYLTVVVRSEWIDDNYKTVVFNSDQVVSSDFYTWFTANATKQS